MADPAAELRAQRGDTGPKVRADPLSGHHQVQAECGAELSDAQQERGALLGFCLALTGAVREVQLCDLVDDDDYRDGPDLVGQLPDGADAGPPR